MMWNKHQSQQLTDDEGVVQVIGEPTDFVIVGSAETEEDTEETQPEPSSQKSTPGSIEEVDDDDTYESEPETTWFGLITPRQYIARVPRSPHRPYRNSWPACQAKVRRET